MPDKYNDNFDKYSDRRLIDIIRFYSGRIGVSLFDVNGDHWDEGKEFAELKIIDKATKLLMKRRREGVKWTSRRKDEYKGRVGLLCKDVDECVM